MTRTKPKMHYHEELLFDIGKGFISNETLLKWFNDNYSTSKHLLTLYSIARGLDAKKILEIGFGRSSFVLAKAASENKGILTCCDIDDFQYLLSEEERTIIKYVNGYSSKIWDNNEYFDFIFLDYFSNESLSYSFCFSEILKAIKKTKTNGIVAIHDTIVDKYRIRKILKLINLFCNVELMSLPYNYGLCLLKKVGRSNGGVLEDKFPKKV